MYYFDFVQNTKVKFSNRLYRHTERSTNKTFVLLFLYFRWGQAPTRACLFLGCHIGISVFSPSIFRISTDIPFIPLPVIRKRQNIRAARFKIIIVFPTAILADVIIMLLLEFGFSANGTCHLFGPSFQSLFDFIASEFDHHFKFTSFFLLLYHGFIKLQDPILVSPAGEFIEATIDRPHHSAGKLRIYAQIL